MTPSQVEAISLRNQDQRHVAPFKHLPPRMTFEVLLLSFFQVMVTQCRARFGSMIRARITALLRTQIIIIIFVFDQISREFVKYLEHDLIYILQSADSLSAKVIWSSVQRWKRFFSWKSSHLWLFFNTTLNNDCKGRYSGHFHGKAIVLILVQSESSQNITGTVGLMRKQSSSF